MIKLNKYNFTKLGTPRSATQEFSINPKNIATIESFRIKGKGGTMITTDSGNEHYVSDEYNSVSKKIARSTA